MSRKAQDLKLAKIGFQAASGAEMQQLVDRKGDKKLNKKGKQSYKGKGVEGPKQVSGEYKNPYWGKYKILKRVYGVEAPITKVSLAPRMSLPSLTARKSSSVLKGAKVERVSTKTSSRGEVRIKTGKVSSIVSMGIINRGIGRTIYGEEYKGDYLREERKGEASIYEKGLAISKGEARDWCEKGEARADSFSPSYLREEFRNREGQIISLGLHTAKKQVKAKLVDYILRKRAWLKALKLRKSAPASIELSKKDKIRKSYSIEEVGSLLMSSAESSISIEGAEGVGSSPSLIDREQGAAVNAMGDVYDRENEADMQGWDTGEDKGSAEGVKPLMLSQEDILKKIQLSLKKKSKDGLRKAKGAIKKAKGAIRKAKGRNLGKGSNRSKYLILKRRLVRLYAKRVGARVLLNTVVSSSTGRDSSVYPVKDSTKENNSRSLSQVYRKIVNKLSARLVRPSVVSKERTLKKSKYNSWDKLNSRAKGKKNWGKKNWTHQKRRARDSKSFKGTQNILRARTECLRKRSRLVLRAQPQQYMIIRAKYGERLPYRAGTLRK